MLGPRRVELTTGPGRTTERGAPLPKERNERALPFPGILRAIAAALTAAVIATLASPAIALPPPPDNPTDQEIANSQSQAEAINTNIGALSASVASTQGQIEQLRNDMELKAELAQKAAIDLDIATVDAQDARSAANEAADTATAAERPILDAEASADRFAAASFRQGSEVGSVSALFDAGSVDELLWRQQLLDAMSAKQLDVLGNLQRAQVSKANLDAAAREALRLAEEKQAAADQAKIAADQANAAAADALSVGQSQLETLEAQLANEQIEYEAAVRTVSTLQDQRQAYNEWLVLKAAEEERLRKEAEEAARKAAEEAARKAAEEAARIAAEEAARKAAEEEAARRAQQAAAQEAARAAAEREAARQAQVQKSRDKAPVAPSAPSPMPAHDGSIGQTVIAAAQQWLGTPYAWGGGTANGPSRGIRDGGNGDRNQDWKKIGFDCSGLALYAYAQVGISLPHYSGYQYYKGARISKANLQPGDLVFWAYNTSDPDTIHHVAIWVGDGRILEAPQSGSTVKFSKMRWNGYIGASRPYA
jgi:cell wall-associated NlpC family hydrolase